MYGKTVFCNKVAMPCTPYCSRNGAANCKSPHTVQTIEHMEVCNEVRVVPEVEEEDSVMESGITDSETTETNSDINSDRRSMMMESRIYSQIIMKKRLNQIKEKSQRLHIRKELVLSYE